MVCFPQLFLTACCLNRFIRHEPARQNGPICNLQADLAISISSTWKHHPSFVHLLKKNFFNFDCAGSSLLCMGFLQVSRGSSSLWCPGLSLWCLLLLWNTGSRVGGLQYLQHPSPGAWASVVVAGNCDSRARPLHGTRDLPGPGMEPGSLAWVGRLLTPGPPGKSSRLKLNYLSGSASTSASLTWPLLTSPAHVQPSLSDTT